MTGSILLAAAVLTITLVIFLRARRLDPRPRKGTILDRLEGTVRLRDIYRLAVSMEEDGAAFYRRLAERAADPEAKKLCSRLADEEDVHRDIFKRQLDEWRVLPVHHTLWPALLEEVRQKGIFCCPPAADASEEEMTAYAIRQEVATMEFYRSFETAFPQAWKRARLHDLVVEEDRHARELRALHARLNPPAQ